MQRNILILDRPDSDWHEFFREFFEDTSSKLNFFHEAVSAGDCLLRSSQDLAFVNPAVFSPAFRQKLKVFRQSVPAFRLFQIGPADEKKDRDMPFDDSFDAPLSFSDFQKKLVRSLPLAEKIRVLVIDDEREIWDMVRDFLKDRTAPSFEVVYADDGEKGLAVLRGKLPDILLLDIKMPVKDGREVYREVKRKGWPLPVIIFFDAISGDEMIEIRKIGNPAVVEKGSHQSAMPEMADLIKKMVYFG